jgi:hypothetical protein
VVRIIPITITTNTTMTGEQNYDKITVSGADLTINGIVRCLELEILGSSVIVEGGKLIVGEYYVPTTDGTIVNLVSLMGLLVIVMMVTMMLKSIINMLKEMEK